MKLLWDLYATWFKMGLFTFGGGMAMLPIIEREVVQKHKWATEEEILDMVAIAESTPGVIAVNSATYIGYKVCGFFGSLFATLGVVLPSFIIILVIALVTFKIINKERTAFIILLLNIFKAQSRAITNVIMNVIYTGITNAASSSSPLPIIAFIKNISPIRATAKIIAVKTAFATVLFLPDSFLNGIESNAPPIQTTRPRIN